MQARYRKYPSWPYAAFAAHQDEKAESTEAVAALRGTLQVRAAELAAARGEAAAADDARQASATELGALRAELEKVMCACAAQETLMSRSNRATGQPVLVRCRRALLPMASML